MLPTDHPDRKFILEGVKDGFSIVNVDSIAVSAEAPNHPSATSPANRDRVEQLILEEVRAGHYVIVDKKPMICSPLAAVPKANGALRLIHDGSRPAGNSMNTYAQSPPVSYQSLDDALSVLRPGMYMAKVDLKSAYRSVRIKESDFTATGLQWTFAGQHSTTFMVDTRLPFGNRLSPFLFNLLTQAVRHIIADQGGFPLRMLTVYLDDFWLAADSRAECQRMLLITINILRRLGFLIAWDKVVGPTRRLTFLGIEICTETMTTTLPHDKLVQFRSLIVATLQRRSMSKRQLQSLIGKLNWITRCVYGGRTFLRRFINVAQSLRAPWHRKRLTQEIYADLRWWLSALSFIEGRSMPIIDNRVFTPVHIDASRRGLAAIWGTGFVFRPLDAGLAKSLPSAYVETLALLPAAQQWAALWANKKIIVHCDNRAAVRIINKGTCRSPLILDALRQVWLLSVRFNFRVCAVYIPAKYNIAADYVSRTGKAPPMATGAICNGVGHKDEGLYATSPRAQYTEGLRLAPAEFSPVLQDDGSVCDTSSSDNDNAVRNCISVVNSGREPALSSCSYSSGPCVEWAGRPYEGPAHRVPYTWCSTIATANAGYQATNNHIDLEANKGGTGSEYAARCDLLGGLPVSLLHIAATEQRAPYQCDAFGREVGSARSGDYSKAVCGGDNYSNQNTPERMQTACSTHSCKPFSPHVSCQRDEAVLGVDGKQHYATTAVLQQQVAATTIRRLSCSPAPDSGSMWVRREAVYSAQFPSRGSLSCLRERAANGIRQTTGRLVVASL